MRVNTWAVFALGIIVGALVAGLVVYLLVQRQPKDGWNKGWHARDAHVERAEREHFETIKSLNLLSFVRCGEMGQGHDFPGATEFARKADCNVKI